VCESVRLNTTSLRSGLHHTFCCCTNSHPSPVELPSFCPVFSKSGGELRTFPPSSRGRTTLFRSPPSPPTNRYSSEVRIVLLGSAGDRPGILRIFFVIPPLSLRSFFLSLSFRCTLSNISVRPPKGTDLRVSLNNVIENVPPTTNFGSYLRPGCFPPGLLWLSLPCNAGARFEDAYLPVLA